MYAVRNPAAQRLKGMCTRVLSKYTESIPGEAFVYRGNAYCALGQPYFALSDFRTAAKHLPLSGKHEADCLKLLNELGDRKIVGSFIGTDDYLSRLAMIALPKGVEIRSCIFGRGVFVNEAKSRGTIIMNTQEPWLRYPLREGLCSHCTKPIGLRSFACPNKKCHEEYCSRDCRSNACALYHSAVCENTGFQGMELDEYTKAKREVFAGPTLFDPVVMLLVLRILASSINIHAIPSVLPEMASLTGQLVVDPKRLVDEGYEWYHRFIRATNTASSISLEELLSVIARVQSNCIRTTNCVYLSISKAMLNHSCKPNAVEHIDSGAVVAIRDIEAGEEVCIKYAKSEHFVCRAPCCLGELQLPK